MLELTELDVQVELVLDHEPKVTEHETVIRATDRTSCGFKHETYNCWLENTI